MLQSSSPSPSPSSSPPLLPLLSLSPPSSSNEPTRRTRIHWKQLPTRTYMREVHTDDVHPRRVRSLEARAWVHADVRWGWRGEDRVCMCIHEEGRQNIWRVWKSAGWDNDIATRGRRWKAEEEANMYRARHCIRVGVDGSTATRPSRKTCVFRLFSAQHSRLVCECRIVRVVRRTTKCEATWRDATLRAYHYRWQRERKRSLPIPISDRPVIAESPLMCPPVPPTNRRTRFNSFTIPCGLRLSLLSDNTSKRQCPPIRHFVLFLTRLALAESCKHRLNKACLSLRLNLLLYQA